MKDYKKFIKVLQIIFDNTTNNKEEKYISSSDIKKILWQQESSTIDTRTIKSIVTLFNQSQDNYEIDIKESNNIKYRFMEGFLSFGEAKAIVDLVYSSNFFSPTVKHNFLRRMCSFFNASTSMNLHKMLDTHVIGNENDESFFKSFEEITDAIHTGHQIDFLYQKPLPGNDFDNSYYEDLCPIETNCDNNTFYVYCYDEMFNKIKSFRIDFIKNVQAHGSYVLTDIIKERATENIKNSTNGFSALETKLLELTFIKKRYPNIIDKFGKNIPKPHHVKDEWYSIKLPCPISNVFYSWVISFGGDIKITKPSSERKKIAELVNKVLSDI